MTASRRLLIILGTIVVGLLAYQAFAFVSKAAWFFAMVGQPCTRDLIDKKASPDGRMSAELIEVNCGATAPYVTKVLLTEVGTAVKDESDVAATFRGQARRLEWDGAELRVFYDQAEPIERPDQYRGTKLSYWRGD